VVGHRDRPPALDVIGDRPQVIGVEPRQPQVVAHDRCAQLVELQATGAVVVDRDVCPP